jgi:hypothetical protein
MGEQMETVDELQYENYTWEANTLEVFVNRKDRRMEHVLDIIHPDMPER